MQLDQTSLKNTMSEFLLNTNTDATPADGISSLAFSHTDPHSLIVGNWNRSVSLYDIDSNIPKWTVKHRAAVLDVCFLDTQVVSASLDKTIKITDLVTAESTTLGTHDDAVKTLTNARELSLLVSGSWDKSIKLFDPRQSKCVSVHEQPQKVFSIDSAGISSIS